MPAAVAVALTRHAVREQFGTGGVTADRIGVATAIRAVLDGA